MSFRVLSPIACAALTLAMAVTHTSAQSPLKINEPTDDLQRRFGFGERGAQAADRQRREPAGAA
jgi:hypothetical protein